MKKTNIDTVKKELDRNPKAHDKTVVPPAPEPKDPRNHGVSMTVQQSRDDARRQSMAAGVRRR
jgi:hypothetical protein